MTGWEYINNPYLKIYRSQQIVKKHYKLTQFKKWSMSSILLYFQKCTWGDAAVAESRGSGGYPTIAYYERGRIVVRIA